MVGVYIHGVGRRRILRKISHQMCAREKNMSALMVAQ